MNWRKIEDNWLAFATKHDLQSSIDERNYGHGLLLCYKAQESLFEYTLDYQNKIYKLGGTESIRKKNGFAISAEFTISDPNFTILLKRNSFWKKKISKIS